MELANAISVYPNPARDRVVVSFPFLNGSETVITIMDIAGKEIFSAVTEGEQRYSILTGAFANGLYIIKIQSGGFVSCKKVLIEK